jgi:hypothetical protein
VLVLEEIYTHINSCLSCVGYTHYINGYFDGVTFMGMIFYLALYGTGYYYITVGINNKEKELQIMEGRKQKFEWCWERVNKILKSMPGGQGLQWAKGVGRRSQFKNFHDGVQNKPYRSILAYLENTQQIVLVIYDIEGDDIADFITSPSPDLYDNPFINFKPFMGSGMGMGMFGSGRYNPYSFSSRKRRPHRPVSINIGGDDDYGDFDQMQERRTQPQDDIVNRAFEKVSGDKKRG